MPVPIRDLKRDYKIQLALGRTLPTHDLAIPLPFSTGHPLFDAALTDKLVATTTLNEPEHVARARGLVREASRDEVLILARHARGLLNDYKLLLALRCWNEGDDATTRTFLRALPWGWRLGFPTAVIKPAARIFTGWRRSLSFRMVDDPRFPALKELYRDVLAEAPPVILLKHRETVHEATALLHYRFEGERERAIHDWCYGNGEAAQGIPELEPIPTYIRARRALRSGGPGAFAAVLQESPTPIPITSFMGLLGSAGHSLIDGSARAQQPLRDYAVRCSTSVESLLRLAEWAPWLKPRHVEVLSARVRESVIEGGLDLPFFKVVKAFLAAPTPVRKMVLEPLLLPLMRHFGTQVSGLLPPPGPLTFLQPGNSLHVMSFLLYTALASATETRLMLLYRDGIEEIPAPDMKAVGAHLADEPEELEEWLLGEFGGLTSRREYTYNFQRLVRALKRLDPAAPLLLDLPFVQDMELLSALLPFQRVFNLNAPYGAPGEVCVAYEYYASLTVNTRTWSYGWWSRYSDSAATRFAELLERLRMFQILGDEARAAGATR